VTSGTTARMYVHRAESGHALVAGLAAVLAEPPDDPFVPDLIAVPTQGIERWLAQQLSHHLGAGTDDQGDGVCANVAFPHPNDILDQTVAATSPEHAQSVQDWHPARTVWPLVDLLADIATATDDRYALLRHHLTTRQDTPTGRRYALGRRIATLFADYGASRPELIRAWAAGPPDDLPDDLAWQPLLWQSLRDALGPSPAELLDDALAAIRAGTTTIDLPPRISVYGPSRIDASRLSVLAALATHRDVHLWLNHASPALWQQLRAHAPEAGADRRRTSTTVRPRNPLLASLSRDIRELQQRLAAVAPDFTDIHHVTPPHKPTTLLQRLQADLRNDVHAGEFQHSGDDRSRDPYVFDPADRSIQIHACHGRARQVEVLRDVILGLLADDHTIEPRDILVMCPDVDAFAPLVTAAFGSEPADELRVQLADRAPRESNPVLATVSNLLDLVAGRVGAPELLAFAGMPSVRTRFGLDDDDLEQLRSWTVEAAARWGIDQPHRTAWQLSSVGDGTWRQAFDRILTGIALGDGDHLWAGVLPLDGLDSGDIDLAGRFAELLDRVAAAVGDLSHDQPAAQWLDRVEQATLALVDVPRDDAWQILQLRAELGDIRDALETSGPNLSLADVRALLDERLAGRPTRTSFRTGGITVCSLVPMRSVPHRVICLLGLDDEAFPRRNRPDGDNLLARDPRIGERDPRSEDRQLFLDAITAATERLIVTYRGAHERTGAPLPPAVPVGELLDALEELTAPDSEVSEHVVVRHPLQPADPRNFTTGALGRTGSLSFDRSGLAGAKASVRARTRAAPFLADPLPEMARNAIVELDVLQRFWANPVSGFLRQRLELSGDWDEALPDESIPLDLDALQKWALRDRALAARLRDLEPASVIARERARGSLPPGRLGDPALVADGQFADQIRASALEWLAPAGVTIPPEAVDVDVALPDGRRLIGTVRGLRDRTLVTVMASNLRPKQRLRAWIDYMAATAARPDDAFTAVVVGKDGRNVAVRTYEGLGHEDAVRELDMLVRLRDLGLRTPLPLPLQTSEAYASRRRKGASVEAAVEYATKEWASGFERRREDADSDHVRVWGPGAAISVLTGWVAPAELPVPAGGDVTRADLDTAVDNAAADREATSFERAAMLVWRPLLDNEAGL